MKKVTLTGWRVGLKKISLTRLILTSTALSLRSAKNIVDELIAGKEMEIEIYEDYQNTFLEAASAIGVIFKDTEEAA